MLHQGCAPPPDWRAAKLSNALETNPWLDSESFLTTGMNGPLRFGLLGGFKFEEFQSSITLARMFELAMTRRESMPG